MPVCSPETVGAFALLVGLKHFSAAHACCPICDFKKADLGDPESHDVLLVEDLIGGAAFDKRVEGSLVEEFSKETGIRRRTPWRRMPGADTPERQGLSSWHCHICGAAGSSAPDGKKGMDFSLQVP